MLEHLITEKWSHSEEIDNAIELVYQAIFNSIPNAHVEPIMKGKLNLIIGNVTKNLFGLDVKIIYYIYDAIDFETFKFAKKECEYADGVDEKKTEMILTLYSVKGEIHEQSANILISHEVEHLLQVSKSKTNNKNYKKLNDKSYERTFEILANMEKYSDIEKDVAWLFYYSNPHEQNAFINEHYYDLCHNKRHIYDRSAPIHKIFKRYKEKVESILTSLENDDEKVVEAIRKYGPYGYRKGNFKTMIQKGLNRFEKKINNVEKHFKDKSKMLRENRWTHGPTTFFGSRRTFKPTF